MKTSNKLLLGGLIVALLIPVFMFLSFKKSVEQQQGYHIIKDNDGFVVTKRLTRQPKVLKIKGTNSFLCNISFSSTASYQYFNYNDSIQVQELGDTLLLSYGTSPIRLENERRPISHFALTISKIPTIIAEEAAVVINEFNIDTNSVLDISLTREAKLSLGTSGQPELLTDTIIEKKNTYFKSRINYQTSLFDKLRINAMSSDINIGPYAGIRSLDLTLKGDSRITIAPTASVRQLKGSLSDRSLFAASKNHFALRDSLRNIPDEM